MNVLTDIGYDSKKPYFEVWNKIDALEPSEADVIN